MSARRIEVLLWLAAAAVLLVGWSRWRAAEPPVSASAPAALAAPAAPAPVPPRRLAEAASRVAAGDVFRLDRAPPPLGFQPAAPVDEGMPPPPPEPPPYRPPLAVTGIVGPPWRAVLVGVPGRDGGVLVRAGDTLADLRVRSVSRGLVVVQGADTTWRLTVNRTWQ